MLSFCHTGQTENYSQNGCKSCTVEQKITHSLISVTYEKQQITVEWHWHLLRWTYIQSKTQKKNKEAFLPGWWETLWGWLSVYHELFADRTWSSACKSHGCEQCCSVCGWLSASFSESWTGRCLQSPCDKNKKDKIDLQYIFTVKKLLNRNQHHE